MLEGMTKLFSVTKTIRFELRPIGKTMENIEKNRTIFKDEKINSNFQQVKLWLDELHKEYIEKTLPKISENINFREALKKYEVIHSSNSSKFEITEEKQNSDNLIKIITNVLTEKGNYDKLFKEEKIKTLIEHYKNDPSKLKIINEFKKFIGTIDTFYLHAIIKL